MDRGKRVGKEGGERGEAGTGTGTGSRERRKTKRRRRRRRRRPRYGGSVAFAGSRLGNEMPPSQLTPAELLVLLLVCHTFLRDFT